MTINEHNKPHFVLLPFLAQGHMIPMVDIARLLAKRGLTITILTTPHNANRFKPVTERAIDYGLDIRIFNLQFPCVEVGLPEGCENLDMVPTLDGALKFFKAVSLLENQVHQVIQELNPKPSCLIADMCYTWATNVSLMLKIPRLVFHGMNCFSLLCTYRMEVLKDFDDLSVSETEYFVMPGLPDDKIEITKSQLRGFSGEVNSEWKKVRDSIWESQVNTFGEVINTFDELEHEYAKEYSRVKGNKLFCIGPVSLCNENDAERAERGNKASVNEQYCLKWLESREKGSVIYACIGSLSCLANSQQIELGLGLEASKRPFIWVIRDASDTLKKWLVEENFEDRVKDRGLLIHGWAPQVLILSHASIGGFLTHCGWNSSLEGITAGVPMVTWPVFAEQFCNEKFIVNAIKTGVRVGVEMPVVFGEEEKAGVLVTSDRIRMAIDELIEVGKEGDERRERARKLKDMANKAIEEGGSSCSNLTFLIEDVMANSGGQEENGVIKF